MGETGANTVERALSIIEVFRTGEDQLSLQTLAARTKLNKATIIRMLAALERFGYIQRMGQGVYALGPAFLTYASLYQSSFRLSDHTLPILRGLVGQTGQSAAFFIRDQDMRVCLYKVESTTGDLISRIREGDRRALLPGGTGKIMLAFSDIPAEREEWPDLRESYVFINLGEERSSEIFSIAIPTFKSNQVLAGTLSLSGPQSSFTPRLVDTYLVHLFRAAAALTHRLGGDPAPLEERMRRAQAKTGTGETRIVETLRDRPSAL